jgi:hypothetical protein
MQKSKPQSKQAPFCTTFLHETSSLFQHHSNLDAKIKQDLNKNQGEKQKLNAVAEKENTH